MDNFNVKWHGAGSIRNLQIDAEGFEVSRSRSCEHEPIASLWE